MVGPQDTYNAGPNAHDVIELNSGTNILTTSHMQVGRVRQSRGWRSIESKKNIRYVCASRFPKKSVRSHQCGAKKWQQRYAVTDEMTKSSRRTHVTESFFFNCRLNLLYVVQTGSLHLQNVWLPRPARHLLAGCSVVISCAFCIVSGHVRKSCMQGQFVQVDFC